MFPRLAVCALALATIVAPYAQADDVLHVGSAQLDPPTLVALGVQLFVSGDDNYDATVTVRFRPTGSGTWRDGLPLRRVHPETVTGRTVPSQFAGSLFDLAPDTAYDIELHALDPDGLVDETRVLTGTTRAVSGDPVTPVARAVADADGLRAALAAAQPGDVITLAAGTYQGPFELAASGTAVQPIVLRGVSDVESVLDGGGCDCNLLEITGSFVHVERLGLQRATRALRFKTAGTQGNVVRRIRIDDVRIGILGDPDQRDFYVADNILRGRLRWPSTYADDGGSHANDDGINVMGSGHVVCHNLIAGFGDALKVEQDGARADDFYGNEVLSAYDNGIELDGSEGNTRCFRNRFTNTFVPLSFQPIFGGPAYALRNVVVNVKEDQLKLYARGADEPNGVVVFHNTFVSPAQTLLMASSATSHHVALRNNLFVGPTAASAAVQWAGPMDDVTLDADGWYPDGVFDFSSAGAWGSFAAMRAAGTFEANGRLLDGPPFASGLQPPPSYRTELPPQEVDLDAGSNAIDGGLVLPNVDDAYTGAAPDLGAVERGCPAPIFGVRPEGIDERNEPIGCGGPPNTTEPAVPVETTKLTLRDDSTPPANAGSRKLTFKSSTGRGMVSNRVRVPSAGGPGDPTLHDAVLTVYNDAGTGERLVVALPSGGWTRIGSPPNVSGYRFRGDVGQLALSIIVGRDRISLTARGAGLAYPLAVAPQGRVALRLALGASPPWCADAPAKHSGNPPSTARNDRVDHYVGLPHAPPPAVCPAVP